MGLPLPPLGPQILPDNPLTGTDKESAGVTGESNFGSGVFGHSFGGKDPITQIIRPGADGVFGQGNNGVRGIAGAEYGTGSAPGGAGVWGANTFSVAGGGPGVYGTSTTGDGVLGQAYHGVHGQSSNKTGSGVWGENTGGGAGVSGTSDTGTAVSGDSTSGVGVQGSSSKGTAGKFIGSVEVDGSLTLNGSLTENGNLTLKGSLTQNGDLTLNGNAKVSGTVTISSGGDIVFSDFAEHFDLAGQEADPGTVMVIDEDGALRQSEKAYDRRVAGVVSGAGSFRPGIVLGQRSNNEGRTMIALVGKVYCKVNADAGPIAIGDLLTSSDVPGHAMKVNDPVKGFGSVIGKALRPLESGRSLLPILVALQ